MSDSFEETLPPKVKPEVVGSKEQLLELARTFRWTNPERNESGGNKSNLRVIEESISMLKELGIVDDVEEELERVKKMRNKANKIYKSIYPSQKEEKKDVLEEPYYHGIRTEDDWYGHNDYVMAVAARLFSGLIKIKKAGSQQEILKLEEFFGKGFQEQELNVDDFRRLMTMAAFHEAGDWWIKDFWQEGIEEQRQQFRDQKEQGVPIRKIKIDPPLRNIIGSWPEEKRKERISKTRRVINDIKEAIQGLGLAIDYNPQVEGSEFILYFADGKKQDVAFIPSSKLAKPTGKRPEILACLFKSADFAQCLSPQYQEDIIYIPEGEEAERIGKLKGSLVLYIEFFSFKPAALPTAGWLEPADADIDRFFYEEFFIPNIDNEHVLGILDFALQEKDFPYRLASLRIENRIKKILGPVGERFP